MAQSISIVTNRPGITTVALMYVIVAIIAMASASAVFYMLLRREADIIKEANGGPVDACN